MPLTVTSIPGKTFSTGSPGEAITYPDLNLLGSPTISLQGEASSSQIGDGSIVTAKLADDAVTTDKIADNSIGLDQLMPQEDGSIISFDGSQDPVLIPPGAAGTILTSAGAGALPAWQSAASYSLYPGDLSSSLDRNTLVTGDTLIVGDTSAGIAKQIAVEEIIGANIYFQMCPSLSQANRVTPALGDTPDAEETQPSLATLTSALGTSNAAQRNLTFMPFAGQVERIVISNNDPSVALTTEVHVVKFDPAAPYTSTVANSSLGTHSVTTAAAFSSSGVDITSGNTFSAGDPLAIWVKTTAGSRPKVTVVYRLDRL